MAETHTPQQLRIENLSEKELLQKHLMYIRRCQEFDLWKDISHMFCYQMREKLGKEIRTRRAAE